MLFQFCTKTPSLGFLLTESLGTNDIGEKNHTFLFFVKLGKMSTNFSQIGNLPFRVFFYRLKTVLAIWEFFQPFRKKFSMGNQNYRKKKPCDFFIMTYLNHFCYRLICCRRIRSYFLKNKTYNFKRRFKGDFKMIMYKILIVLASID